MSAAPSSATDAIARALRSLPANASRQSRRIVADYASQDRQRQAATMRGLVTTIRHGCDHDWMLARYEVRLSQWQGVVRDDAAKTWGRFQIYNLGNRHRHTVDVFVGPDGELMATCDESCVMFTGMEHGTCLHVEFFLTGLEEAIRENDRALELLGLDGLELPCAPAVVTVPPSRLPAPSTCATVAAGSTGTGGYAAMAARTECEYQEARDAMRGTRRAGTTTAAPAAPTYTAREAQPVSDEMRRRDWED